MYNTGFKINAKLLTVKTYSSLEALGSIIAEDVRAKLPHPPFPASVKDGYAVIGKHSMSEWGDTVVNFEVMHYIFSILMAFKVRGK